MHANPRPITQRNATTFESRFDLFRDPNESCSGSRISAGRNCCAWSASSTAMICDPPEAAHLQRRVVPCRAPRRILRIAQPSERRVVRRLLRRSRPSDADKRDSGALCFVNPALSAAMHLDPGNARMSGAFAGGIRSLRMEAGQLVLFPSWVLHDVKPFEGEGERVTVAFNCWFGSRNRSDQRMRFTLPLRPLGTIIWNEPNAARLIVTSSPPEAASCRR